MFCSKSTSILELIPACGQRMCWRASRFEKKSPQHGVGGLDKNWIKMIKMLNQNHNMFNRSYLHLQRGFAGEEHVGGRAEVWNTRLMRGRDDFEHEWIHLYRDGLLTINKCVMNQK